MYGYVLYRAEIPATDDQSVSRSGQHTTDIYPSGYHILFQDNNDRSRFVGTSLSCNNSQGPPLYRIVMI